jgi:hypothetical protein
MQIMTKCQQHIKKYILILQNNYNLISTLPINEYTPESGIATNKV